MELKLTLLEEKDISIVAKIVKKATSANTVEEIEEHISNYESDSSITVCAKNYSGVIKGAYVFDNMEESKQHLLLPSGWVGCTPEREGTGSFIMTGLNRLFSHIAYVKGKELIHSGITYRSKPLFLKFGYEGLNSDRGFSGVKKTYAPKKTKLSKTEEQIVDTFIVQSFRDT